MNYVNGTNAAEVMHATDRPDIIVGGDGSDAIHGNGGKDVYVIDASDIKEFIMDFEDGRDLVDLRATGVTSFDQLIQLYEYDSDIVETSIGTMRLYLNLRNDPDGRVDISPEDFIFADTPVHEYSAGNDTANVTSNVYSIHFGNGGNDMLNLFGLVSSAGREGVTLNMDPDRYGTGSFDLNGVTQHFFEFRSVRGTLGHDTINGSTASNVISGQSGADVISGGLGHDVLRGNAGIDRLNGGAGDDQLAGGVGRDALFGGQGADKFFFYAADHSTDRVGDFENGIDQLDISDWGVTGLEQLAISTDSNGSLTVAYAAGDVSFTVSGSGLSAGDLTSDDFIFA